MIVNFLEEVYYKFSEALRDPEDEEQWPEGYPESDNKTLISLVMDVEERILGNPDRDTGREGFYWLADMAKLCTRHEEECKEYEWAESTLEETKEYMIEALVRIGLLWTEDMLGPREEADLKVLKFARMCLPGEWFINSFEEDFREIRGGVTGGRKRRKITEDNNYRRLGRKNVG